MSLYTLPHTRVYIYMYVCIKSDQNGTSFRKIYLFQMILEKRKQNTLMEEEFKRLITSKIKMKIDHVVCMHAKTFIYIYENVMSKRFSYEKIKKDGLWLHMIIYDHSSYWITSSFPYKSMS